MTVAKSTVSMLAGVLLVAGCAAADGFGTGAGREASAINEGALHLLQDTPPTRVLRPRNRLHIRAGSRAGGWVELEQCHADLDPVAALAIEYR